MKQKDYRKYLKTRGPQTRRPASARAFKDKKTTLMIDILGSAIPNKRYKVHFDNRTTGARKRNPLKKKAQEPSSILTLSPPRGSPRHQKNQLFGMATQTQSLQIQLKDTQNRLEMTQKRLADQIILNENLAIKIELLNDEKIKAEEFRATVEQLQNAIKTVRDENKSLKLKNGDLELRICNLLKTERRLLEMLKNCKEYKDIANIADSKTILKKSKNLEILKMSRSGTSYRSKSSRNSLRKKKPSIEIELKALNDNNLIYLEGSKAITQFDADTPALSRTYHHKMPLHFRQWYKKARTGLLEEEKNLWTTQKSIQIVRDFMKGKFSKREDLAIEKLIYELGKEQRKIEQKFKEKQIRSLKQRIMKSKKRVKQKNEAIDTLMAYIKQSELITQPRLPLKSFNSRDAVEGFERVNMLESVSSDNGGMFIQDGMGRVFIPDELERAIGVERITEEVEEGEEFTTEDEE